MKKKTKIKLLSFDLFYYLCNLLIQFIYRLFIKAYLLISYFSFYNLHILTNLDRLLFIFVI